MRNFSLILLMSILLVNCASGPNYSCKVPNGVGCMSISDVYEKSINGELRKTTATKNEDAFDDESDNSDYSDTEVTTNFSFSKNKQYGNKVSSKTNSGRPIRSRSIEIRIKIYPWVDSDNDFNTEQYLYTEIAKPRWLLRENLKHFEKTSKSGQTGYSYLDDGR